MIVNISEAAKRDLAEIGDYIAQDDPHRAFSFVMELEAKCLGLADFPDAHPLVDRYAKQGLRRCRHGKYLIFFYRRGARVTVIRVIHASRDYLTILES